MTLYIGVDIHARQQTVSYLNTEDGSIEHQELHALARPGKTKSPDAGRRLGSLQKADSMNAAQSSRLRR